MHPAIVDELYKVTWQKYRTETIADVRACNIPTSIDLFATSSTLVGLPMYIKELSEKVGVDITDERFCLRWKEYKSMSQPSVRGHCSRDRTLSNLLQE